MIWKELRRFQPIDGRKHRCWSLELLGWGLRRNKLAYLCLPNVEVLIVGVGREIFVVLWLDSKFCSPLIAVSDLLPSSLILPIVEYFKDIITLRICQHQPVYEILQHFVRCFWVWKAQSILHTYSKGSYGSPRIPGCYHWRNRQLETFRKSWDGWVSERVNRFFGELHCRNWSVL